jgi:hypothetical protein
MAANGISTLTIPSGITATSFTQASSYLVAVGTFNYDAYGAGFAIRKDGGTIDAYMAQVIALGAGARNWTFVPANGQPSFTRSMSQPDGTNESNDPSESGVDIWNVTTAAGNLSGTGDGQINIALIPNGTAFTIYATELGGGGGADKEARQKAKLDLAQAKRQGKTVALDGTISGVIDPTKSYYRINNKYDITNLPTQYIDNVATNNLNEGGLQLGRPWVTFLPSDLFAASEKGVWYDPGDITTLFQDTAGTIPVTASGQTVALMKDKSGNSADATQSDATKRPTFRVYAGTDYGYLSFDGTNDFMVTSAINFTGTAVMTATAGFQVVPPTGVTGPRIVVELSASSVTNEGSFYMTGPATSSDHSVGLRGNSASQAYASFANVDPSDDILTAQLNIGAATKELELIPRLNGVVKSGGSLTWGGAANAGTGNFGNYALYIGARGGTSLFFKGNLYGMVIRGATSTAPQITATEAWVTARLY